MSQQHAESILGVDQLRHLHCHNELEVADQIGSDICIVTMS